jgi:hypothetical protein
VMELCHRWYSADGPGDESVLPRSIATEKAFQNAMALDVAMGGSTNTVLHILAAAHEAEVNLTMADIDAVSRRVPCLANVSPSSDYHMEDVHRAGGIPAILGELDRAERLPRTSSRRVVPCRARRRAHDDAVLDGEPLVLARHRRRRGLHSGPRARLHHRGRVGRAVRQPGQGRCSAKDRRRARGDLALRGTRAGGGEPGAGGLGDPRPRAATGRRAGGAL